MAQHFNSLIIIQYDWEDVLCKLNGEIWVMYKRKGEPSIHGTIKCLRLESRGLSQLSSNNGFSVEWVATDCLKVNYSDAPYTTFFISATKVYSGIHKKAISSLDISPEGYSVSVCRENQIVVWDFNQGELKTELVGHIGDVYRCKFFPSGVVILTGGADMRLKIWSAEDGKCPVTLVGHTMAVTDFDFIDKGKNVLSVSKDGRAKLWCSAAEKCIADIASLNSAINCCQVVTLPFQQNSQSLPLNEGECGTEAKAAILGCEDGSVHIVDIRGRRTLNSFTCHSAVNTITSLDQSNFLVGCQSGQIFLYSLTSTNQPIKEWFESNSAVLCVAAYKEEGFISSHADGNVIYRHIEHGNKRVVLTGSNCDPVYEIRVNGKYLYTCCRDALIRRYTLENVIRKVIKQ